MAGAGEVLGGAGQGGPAWLSWAGKSTKNDGAVGGLAHVRD